MINGEEFWKLFSKPIKIIVIIFIVLLCLLFLFLGYKFGSKKEPAVEVQVDTVLVERTHYITEHHFDTTEKIVYKPYKVYIHDTINNKKDSLETNLPYISGVASIPDTLDVYYHGWIDAGVDSIKFGVFKTTEIINRTIEIPKYITPRVMINAGIGYAYYDKSYVYAIGSVNYNTKYLTCSAFGGYSTNFQLQRNPFFGASVNFRIDIK